MIDRQDQFKASVHFTPIEQASGNTGNKCMPFSRLYYIVWTAFRFFQRKSLSLLFSYIKIHLTFFSTGAHRGTSLLWIEFDSHKGVIIAVCRIPFHVNISQTYSNVIRDAYAFAISLSLSLSSNYKWISRCRLLMLIRSPSPLACKRTGQSHWQTGRENPWCAWETCMDSEREMGQRIRLHLFCLTRLLFQWANGAEEIGAPRIEEADRSAELKKVSINVWKTMS